MIIRPAPEEPEEAQKPATMPGTRRELLDAIREVVGERPGY